jgi:hypothetical protein
MPSEGKLQVLILDDLASALASPLALRNLRDWFDFVVAEAPHHVFAASSGAALEGAIAKRAAEQIGGAAVDTAFDIYLADMRLCANDDGTCTNRIHLETGLHTQGAGFPACLMWAIRSPRHPQVIVPYSVTPAQFQDTLKLCRSIKPRTIYFAVEEHVDNKTGTSLNTVLSKALPSVRENLLLSHEMDCYVPIAERERISSLLQGGDGEVDANERINVRYGLQSHPIKIGCLFFDYLDADAETVPAVRVQEFVDALPLVDPVEFQARELAAAFHLSAYTKQSTGLHSIARQTRVSLDAETNGRVARSQTKPIWYKYTRTSEEVQVIRLAVIFGLILLLRHDPIHHIISEIGGLEGETLEPYRLVAFSDEELNEKVIDGTLRTNSLRDLIGPVVGALDKAGRKKAGAFLRDNLEEICRASNSIEDLISDPQDPLMSQFVRFLDPFPGRPSQPPSLAAEDRWAKGMESVGFDVAQLRKLTPHPMSAFERVAALRFVGDVLPPGAPLPRWISGGSQMK